MVCGCIWDGWRNTLGGYFYFGSGLGKSNAILLFNGLGDEQKGLRVVGFMPPGRFSQRLQELNTK